MTFHSSYFINYCLPIIIDQLYLYAFTLFQAQPLLFFITASRLFIPPEIICQYFEISCHHIDITLNYLYRTILQLNTRVGYLIRLDDRDIIFDFSPPSEEESEDFELLEDAEEVDRLTQIQQDIILEQISRDLIQESEHELQQQLYCSESIAQLFPSDTEMEDIEITSTDYENIDEDINYDIDDLDCSTFPEDY